MKENTLYIQDTIVASASASGLGGVNVIRVSGINTEKITEIILGKIPSPRMATHQEFFNKEKRILEEPLTFLTISGLELTLQSNSVFE